WEIISNSTARLLTLTCLTPEAPKRTRITQFTWWTGAPLLNLAIPVAKRMGQTFLAQDGRMVDLQNEGMAHQKAMLWIDDIDVQAKWYQMLKREWTAARSEGREFANPIEPRVLKWMS
ncbi:MAG: 2Fe-2S ferredoxin, partial [Hyphomonas sp. 34-62-18]